MSYQTCTTALLTLIRAYNAGVTFTSATSAENDWRVLNQASAAAIVHMAGDTEEGDMLDGRGASGKRQVRHTIGITIAQPIGADADSVALAALDLLCEALMAYLRPYARLNNASGVKRAEIVTRTRDRLIGPRDDQGTHWVSTIVLRVYEEMAMTFAESPA